VVLRLGVGKSGQHHRSSLLLVFSYGGDACSRDTGRSLPFGVTEGSSESQFEATFFFLKK
jgi:hypothetical protein